MGRIDSAPNWWMVGTVTLATVCVAAAIGFYLSPVTLIRVALFVGMAAVWILALVIFLLPTGIAVYRNHHQIAPIVVINVLCGLSILGWVGALVWAVSEVRKT